MTSGTHTTTGFGVDVGKGARVGVGLGAAVGTGVGAAVGAGVGSGAEHASNTTITMDTTIRLSFDKILSYG